MSDIDFEYTNLVLENSVSETFGKINPGSLGVKKVKSLVAKKFDGSPFRKNSGRPAIDSKLEKPIIRFAEENPSWAYDRIS